MDDSATIDVIGDLALADAALARLLLHLLRLLPDAPKRDDIATGRITTGTAANVLQGYRKTQVALFPPQTEDWLSAIVVAAEDRNAVIHAAAANRCGSCGNVTRFDHRGQDIDRSRAAVRAVTARIDELTREGSVYADEVAERVNAAAMEEARRLARETGEIQNPLTVRMPEHRHVCASCSETGQAVTTVVGGTAHVVLPPGTDLNAFARWRRGGAD